jgi:hypothetical protein
MSVLLAELPVTDKVWPFVLYSGSQIAPARPASISSATSVLSCSARAGRIRR